MALIFGLAISVTCGCAARSRLVEETMRIETQMERPPELAVSTEPAMHFDDVQRTRREGSRTPSEVIRLFGDVQFRFGSTTLLAPSRARLDQLIDWLERGGVDGDTFIEIRGHTDGTGGVEYNRRLAHARAEVVRHYISTKMRLPADRIRIVSVGARAPAASDDTAEGRSQNRRAVVLVLR